MNAWIGNAIGSGIGLVALLLAALWNAHLTRRRDDEQKKLRAASISAALGAEIGGYAHGLWLAYASLLAWVDAGERVRVERLLLADPVVWPKLADQLGEIEPDNAADVATTWQVFELLRRDLEHFASNLPDARRAADKLKEVTTVRDDAMELSVKLMPNRKTLPYFFNDPLRS